MDEPTTVNRPSKILHNSLCKQLIELGIQAHTATVLTCLHYHGASTSRDLQTKCHLRQPDVSIAINELREMNLIAHMYRLRHTLEQSLMPFIQIAQVRAKDILCGIDTVKNIVHSISNEQGSESMVA